MILPQPCSACVQSEMFLAWQYFGAVAPCPAGEYVRE
uniref:Uncharacterized protein n=1 Tax=Anguilla anguilla TaxID=7936 RepID=A0A0E9T3K5_ANGAN